MIEAIFRLLTLNIDFFNKYIVWIIIAYAAVAFILHLRYIHIKTKDSEKRIYIAGKQLCRIHIFGISFFMTMFGFLIQAIILLLIVKKIPQDVIQKYRVSSHFVLNTFVVGYVVGFVIFRCAFRFLFL